MTEEEHDDQDLSSRTLFVLVLLVLVVSFIGAWVSISQVALVQAPLVEPDTVSNSGAEARIEILPRPEAKVSNSVGMAILDIRAPPE